MAEDDREGELGQEDVARSPGCGHFVQQNIICCKMQIILGPDHGVQAAKLPRIHLVRQWVNKTLIGKRSHGG